MTNEPDPTPPEQPPESPLEPLSELTEPSEPSEPPVKRRPSRRARFLKRAGIGAGAAVLLGGGVILIWGNLIITEVFLPRVKAAVEGAIERPVEIGDVQGFSLWSIRLGKSTLPPIPSDKSSATVEEIEISIGLRALIFQQILKPEIVIKQPELALVQAENGDWFELKTSGESEDDPRVTLEIQSIEVKDARVTAEPFVEPGDLAIVPRESVEIENADVLAEFFGEAGKQVSFDVTADVESGELAVKGEADLTRKALKTNLRAKDLPITAANIFLPDSLGIRSGELSSNLTVAAALTEDGELDLDAIDMEGTAQLREGEALAEALSVPVTDIRSQLRFKGQRVTLEDTALQVGDNLLTASGDVDREEGYDLDAQIPAFTLAQIENIADVDLPANASGAFKLDAQVTGDIENPEVAGTLDSLEPLLIGDLSLQTVAADFALTQSAKDSALPLLLDLNRLFVAPSTGGAVIAEGLADLSDFENPTFQLSAQADLPADSVAADYGVALPEEIVLGNLTADITASGNLEAQTASAQWRLSESTFPGSGEITLVENVAIAQAFITPTAGGTVDANGTIDITDLNNPTFQLSAFADVPTDSFAAAYGVAVPADVTIGNLTADVAAAGNLNSQTASAQWRLSESTFPGSGEIALVDNVVVLDNTRLFVAEGTVDAEAALQLESGRWQVAANTNQVPIEQFTRQAQGLLSADVEAFGNLDNLSLEAIDARGRAAIARAAVYLPNSNQPLLDRGLWTTAFEWQGDRIAVEAFNAPGIQANGTIGVDFNKSIPIGNFALDIALNSFDLQPLNGFVPAQLAEYGQLAGQTSFNGEVFGNLENPQVVGNARLNNFAVSELLFEPLSGPIALSLQGGGSANLTGQQDRIQLVVDESAWPESFEIRNQDFVAKGYGEGRQLYADIIDFPIGKLNARPVAQFGFGEIQGVLNASIEANLSDFSSPIAEGNLTVTDPTLQPVEAQQLSANFRYANDTAILNQGELLFNDSRYLLSGQAQIAPTIQYEGALTIAEGRIEDLIPIVEQINLTAFQFGGPQPPTGSAADLTTRPVGTQPPNILENFVAFLEANPVDETELAESRETSIPPLDELEGEFTGVIEVAGASLALEDLTADFNLQGDSWEWGSYTEPNEFVISGDIKQATVDIDKVKIDAGETEIALSGSGNLNRLDGKLRVENLPVKLAELLYPLPANIVGDLDLATTFSGSLANPVVNGKATVTETQVNGYDIETVSASFDYRNALLDVDGRVAVNDTSSPVKFTGDIPYALPFMTVSPRTELIAAKATVPSDNFALINSFTDDQVRWESGRGEIVLQVGGTLMQPAIVGTAKIRDGVVSTAYLEDSVTAINGDVQFNLEEIVIGQLSASLGDGQLAVDGSLPLLPSGRAIVAQLQTQNLQTQQISQNTDGIVVTLSELPVDYDNTLEAVVDGSILIAGAVLTPTIGGRVEIDGGEVKANKLLGDVGSVSLPSAEEIEEINPYRADFLGIDPLAIEAAERPQGILDRVTLQNFEVSLGNSDDGRSRQRVDVVGTPFYRLSAVGDLTINGPISSPVPNGVIELKSGWINLFSTEFELDSDAPNTATFTPETGINPYVDVLLSARVREADIAPAPPTAGKILSAETEEAPVGIQTVGEIGFIEVQAIAQGQASELTDNIVLTSRPNRSQGKLLALLGNNVFSGLTGASATELAGFAFSGGNTLSNLGDSIANAVGLRSFSVNPTTDTGSDSPVGFGIEIEATAAPLGDRLEISAAQIINGGSPPQLGIEYNFTDSLDFRAASNLEDTDFELEYRIRF